ncbi:hypothetical protein FA15DRAFT_672003 [Coprinopsis marcescibilis]|uniref:Uncharacterized protein n=1 Tax=Coprinopsis marcescibilis TaxID=230819 RepID=A0A5C3KQ37_COPMA|nr:hypothetical protein FA15DRAFT_672003 [Coprinopsis marcescibilis]
MILRYLSLERLPFLLAVLSCCLLLVRADDFDCIQTLGGTRYNLTILGEQSVNRTRATPPTTTVDYLRFNLCEDLAPKADLPDHDQCPSGTRACLYVVNLKMVKNEDQERITSVIPLAHTEDLKPDLSLSKGSSKDLVLIFHGPEYPKESNVTTPISQSLKITLSCDRELSPGNSTVEGYDGAQFQIAYTGIAGCPIAQEGGDDNGGGDDKVQKPVGSGLGWFFFILLFMFLAYFGIGAYHNYSTYGARGMDLIPHRDFWQEVPYMISDVVSHLCSSSKPRSARPSRSGYVQV